MLFYYFHTSRDARVNGRFVSNTMNQNEAIYAFVLQNNGIIYCNDGQKLYYLYDMYTIMLSVTGNYTSS
jgi:hypothetical protein